MSTLKIPDREIFRQGQGGYLLMIFTPGGRRSELPFRLQSPY